MKELTNKEKIEVYTRAREILLSGNTRFMCECILTAYEEIHGYSLRSIVTKVLYSPLFKVFPEFRALKPWYVNIQGRWWGMNKRNLRRRKFDKLISDLAGGQSG